MNPSKELFTPGELMQFEAIAKRNLMASAKAPLLIFYCMLQGLTFTAVFIIEWEIIYRVFDYLSGEGEGYWAPELMGCTAAIMIIGFHLLAESKPDNSAVRIVETAVQILIPVYLLGIGLLIAAILYGDGLGGLVAMPPDITLGMLVPEASETSWLERVFAQITNPASVLTFSLGIGGLAIVNIFVAHQLLKKIKSNGADLFSRMTQAKETLKDCTIIKRAQKAYAELSNELEALEQRNDAAIRLMIATDVVSVISEALLPHKVALNEKALNPESRFGKQGPIDTRLIAKNLAQIEAISLADVLAALNPKCLEKKS